MAEKEQQSPIALAPARRGQERSDTEAADVSATEQRRRRSKRNKCFLNIFLFALLQAGIILLFTFTVMKIRTPKFCVLSATSDNSDMAAAPTNGSLSLTMSTELGVKNSNFGRFKFERTAVYFYYDGAQVAVVEAAEGRANWRSTKKFKVAVDVKVASSARLERDLSAGVVRLRSRAEMRGNVRVAMMVKKKRSSFMNCTMDIMVGAPQLTNILCE